MNFDTRLSKYLLSPKEVHKLENVLENKDTQTDKLMESLEDAYAEITRLKKVNQGLEDTIECIKDKNLKDRYYIQALYNRLERKELDLLKAEMCCRVAKEYKEIVDEPIKKPKRRKRFNFNPFYA